ncbi:hypothetical protein Glove_126g11 [Diversispora epigaea]|uniref:Uncharacterized protein n=1 Tax=Diversispora epigaea TaxID=1348612 RepID=A0A397IYC1_9GLOM|nr:hypothetical protein Glove_126g11 [Diversispora epigaea]
MCKSQINKINRRNDNNNKHAKTILNDQGALVTSWEIRNRNIRLKTTSSILTKNAVGENPPAAKTSIFSTSKPTKKLFSAGNTLSSASLTINSATINSIITPTTINPTTINSTINEDNNNQNSKSQDNDQNFIILIAIISSIFGITLIGSFFACLFRKKRLNKLTEFISRKPSGNVGSASSVGSRQYMNINYNSNNNTNYNNSSNPVRNIASVTNIDDLSSESISDIKNVNNVNNTNLPLYLHKKSISLHTPSHLKPLPLSRSKTLPLEIKSLQQNENENNMNFFPNEKSSNSIENDIIDDKKNNIVSDNNKITEKKNPIKIKIPHHLKHPPNLDLLLSSQNLNHPSHSSLSPSTFSFSSTSSSPLTSLRTRFNLSTIESPSSISSCSKSSGLNSCSTIIDSPTIPSYLLSFPPPPSTTSSKKSSKSSIKNNDEILE